MLDPELADRLVGVGQGVAIVGQGVREKRRIEVHADPPGLRPVDPVLEVLGLESVALDLPASGLGVAGVEVQTMCAGQERQRLVQVGSQLVGCAGLAGITAGDRQAAPQLLATVLETTDVVSLPAVQRDRDCGQLLDGRLDIDAPFRVLFFRAGEGSFHVLVGSGHDAVLNQGSGGSREDVPGSILPERAASCQSEPG